MNYKVFIVVLFALLIVACSEVGKSFRAWQTIDRFQIQDELVVDKVSGLMWTRCLLGATWNGVSCEGKPHSYSWHDLQNSAEIMKYAGYSDWRTPSLNELKMLADKETGSGSVKIPHINQTVFPVPNCHGTQSGLNNDGHICWHWTSTPIEGSSHHAWIVYFGYGYGSANYEADTFALLLVRNQD